MSTSNAVSLTPISQDISRVYLMAEDDPADAELVKQMLAQAFDEEYAVVCVDRFEKIQTALANGTFEALILDMNLPDRSGIDNVSQLGCHFPELPIVVLTGQDDLSVAVEALKRGAQDYLTKNNVTPEVLSRSLRYAQERKSIELKLKKALDDSADRNHQLEKMARHDFLTSLPNRAYFECAATKMLYRAARSNKQVALLYFDLNNFKKVNDNFGHATGDALLRQVANRTKDIARETDFIARLGGDEFVIITDLLESKSEVYSLVNRLLETFEEPFIVESHKLLSSTSIGVAFYPDANNVNSLLKQADCAMYEAKVKRHVPVCFFTTQMGAIYTRNLEIESQIGNALSNNELDVLFQPIHSLSGPAPFHAEALLRWHSPALGYISAKEFIPVIENSPIINELTNIVLKKSKSIIRALVDIGHDVERININVTASQLTNPSFRKQLLIWLDDYDISPQLLCLELTEREMVKNADQCSEQITMLRDDGFCVALDDFGTGYSSITHLLSMPIDYLKLDRLLVDHIDKNTRNQALTAGIIEMAHRLNMKVVAEGIERKEELTILEQLGCDFLQGFYLSKPTPIDELLCQSLRNNDGETILI